MKEIHIKDKAIEATKNMKEAKAQGLNHLKISRNKISNVDDIDIKTN